MMVESLVTHQSACHPNKQVEKVQGDTAETREACQLVRVFCKV